ncbi:MAG: autotransporter-associated beta strand repeat-containing protein, partial [Limisphaerales bacterium]
ADVVRLVAADQIANTSAVTITASGLFDLAGFNETMGSLTGSAGGQVTLGGGTLTAGDSTSTTYAGGISGTGGLTKAGSGTLTLTGANTYSGASTISSGVINAQNATSLGAGAVSVTSGAALELAGSINVNQPLTLNGGGIGGNGALRNVSGNNTWSGAVTLGSASTIQTDSGTLTVSSTVGGGALTIEGVGNTTISGIISGTGSLSKNDSGIVTLGAANTYSGNTTINAGTLTLGATGSIVSSPTITIASGATYNVSAVSGYTVGALQTIARNATSGAGTVSGTMALASGAKISLQADGSASSIGTVTVAGGLSLNNNTITINVTGAALGIGTYTLVTYTGTRTGAFSNTPTITGSGIGSGLTATLVQGSGTISLQVAAPGHGIAAARIKVVENDLANNNTSVTVSTIVSINGMSIRDGSSRGDYTIQIGSTETDDFANGAVMTCVAENGRDNGEDSGINYCTSSIASSSGISYFIPTSQAPTGAEYNINVAAAYFPYNRYIAGFAKNSAGTSGGPNDSLTGSPGLILGTHFIDHGDGTSTVNLMSMGINSQTDGILLVTAAANDNKYAVTEANADGTWTILVKDNGTNGTTTTQGPVSFAYVPLLNSSVITGKFHSDGTILMYYGASPRFNVVSNSTGTWTLTIPGYSPSSGVLVISPETAGGANADNLVSYQPSGSSWIITSRDLPGLGLQTPGDPVCSFVFVPAPTATLVAPANNSTITSSPTLTVTANNPGTGNVKVTFFGHRAAIPGPGSDFLIPVLPDTQNYAREASSSGQATRYMWYAQTDWITAHRDSDNIPFVATLGDCVQNGDTLNGNPNEGEWRIATNAYYRLEDQQATKRLEGIPYLVTVGNHDQDPNGDPDGTTTLDNKYFGSAHFNGKSYYGGHYSTNNDTWYALFSAGNLDFLVISFEYGRYGQGVLDWSQSIIDQYPKRRILVLTHHAGDDTPDDTTVAPFSPQGQAIYTALRTNANFFMMLGGHVFNEGGEGRRSDTFNGHTVRTLISDYQGRFNGGNGLMRLMYFSPSNNLISVKTYSPYTDLFETDANSQFTYTYNMQPNGAGSPETAYVSLGTNSNVVPGAQTSVIWSGLTASKTYEWYVTVTDQNGDYSTSTIFTFLTGVNFALMQSPNADLNGNGLPDSWETKYHISDPNADDDGDGQSNYAEYRAGTDPTSSASVLKITSSSCSADGHVTLTWSSVGGVQYRIQVASSPDGPFTDIVRDISDEVDPAPAGQPSTQTYTDGTSSPNSIRFYRIEVP